MAYAKGYPMMLLPATTSTFNAPKPKKFKKPKHGGVKVHAIIEDEPFDWHEERADSMKLLAYLGFHLRGMYWESPRHQVQLEDYFLRGRPLAEVAAELDRLLDANGVVYALVALWMTERETHRKAHPVEVKPKDHGRKFDL